MDKPKHWVKNVIKKCNPMVEFENNPTIFRVHGNIMTFIQKT